MAINAIKLPNNTKEGLEDSRIPSPAAADSGKVLGVTDTSGTLGWVQGGSGDAVLYTAQSLTDAQKLQARTNIGTIAEGTETTTVVETGTLATKAYVDGLVGDIESLLAAI